MMSSARQRLTVLLVEDDSVDAEGVTRALGRHDMAKQIVRTSDGREALERLLDADPVSTIREPYVILLDLNMPRMNGLEFLSVLRGVSELKNSIVFVLTTSNDDRDLVGAYDHNVAGYLLKDQIGEDFEGVVAILEHYWANVEFPPERCHGRG